MHATDHDDFITLVKAARKAYNVVGNGHHFNEVSYILLFLSTISVLGFNFEF